MRTDFVLDALEQALYIWQPERDGSLICHSDRGSQCASIRYSERLAEASIETSVCSKGASYDNALAKTINGLYDGATTRELDQLSIQTAAALIVDEPQYAKLAARLLATFVDDALVNDQLVDYWGKPAIAAWAARDIIGERLTLEVVKTVRHYGHSIVTAHVDGLFDKRGLPDPLVLAFYFSSHDDKIVQLIILRNQSGI